jgi:hypothetical protein
VSITLGVGQTEDVRARLQRRSRHHHRRRERQFRAFVPGLSRRGCLET